MQVLREVQESTWTPLPADHGHLSSLDASYAYLRQFAPQVLAMVDFQGGPGTAELMRALTILKQRAAILARKFRVVRPQRRDVHAVEVSHVGAAGNPQRPVKGSDLEPFAA